MSTNEEQSSHDRHRKKKVRKTSSELENDDERIEKRRQRRHRRHRGQSKELPITEILKRAQQEAAEEQQIIRTRYEDPLQFQQLPSTNKIYIQGRNGHFNSVKITDEDKKLRHVSPIVISSEPRRVINAAINIQKLWKSFGKIYQGFLAGFAFMHFVLLQIYSDKWEFWMNNYTKLSETYTSVFTLLTTLSVISILDKYDVARLDGNHLQEVYTNHGTILITLPMYLLTYCLALCTVDFDDRLSLSSYRGNENYWNTSVIEREESFKFWRQLTMSKDLLSVVAWILVCLGNDEDMLMVHLKSIKFYTIDGNSENKT